MDLWERCVLGTEHRWWACRHAIGDTLEVAIGTGRNLAHYPLGVRLAGVDRSMEMLRRASARAHQLGRPVDLQVADACALPFGTGTFDTVVCTYALCSVPDDRTAVEEMVRVLRPGGQLIMVDHVGSTVAPLYWLQRGQEAITVRTSGEYQTRRPALHAMKAGLHAVAHQRLRAGIVERLIARKSLARNS